MSTDIELVEWSCGSNYGGEDYSGNYSVIGRHRDSGLMDIVNFEAMSKVLVPLGGFVIRSGHWAVGWVEQLLVPMEGTERYSELCINAAKALKARLEDYPCLDDDEYSRLEWEDAYESWKDMCLEDRIEILKENNLSIFSARRDDFSTIQDESGSIQDQLLNYI